MSNRYILDTSGKIIKIDTFKISGRETISLIVTENEPKESSYYDENEFDGNETYLGSFRKDGAGSSYGSMGAVELTFINDTTNNNNIIKSLTDENPSFGFIGQNGEETSVETKQFRQYNNANVLSNKDGKPLPFVNEFEFYSGFTDPFGEDNNPGLESLNLLVNYFTSVVVEAAIIESLIVLYKLAQDSSTIQGNRLDTNKKFLVMGEYILDEVDVFSRYFFDVINYPIEEKSVSGTYFLKRLACYFIGLNEWLSHDRVFSWERFLNVDNVPIIGSLNADLKTILEKTVDITLSNFSNASSLKRILLLVKKFNTQKYWVNEQLYRFKSKNYSDEITNIYNYYYFKFFIERVNVGIKIYNRIYADDSVKNLVKSDNSKYKTNRISQDFNDKNTLTHINFNNEEELSNIKNSIRDLALGDKSGAELAAEVNKIKTNLKKAKNQSAIYSFKYDYKGLSLKNIPSATMFNKKSVPPTSEYILNLKQNFAKTNENYLPIELVNEIETKLEYEYMPFYFHDLRTNEILSFHAFIENITDNYSPEYTATSGFGRIDDVRAYVKTTRTISLSFLVVSMNPGDHETMWYYLNKLVSMVYPQWSDGEELVIDGYKMQQPFSQVPTNSPLIRLRLGDLIKNNYSRFNLGKLFGLNNRFRQKIGDVKKTKIENEIQENYTSNEDWEGMSINIEEKKKKLLGYLTFKHKMSFAGYDRNKIISYLMEIDQSQGHFIICYDVHDYPDKEKKTTFIEIPEEFVVNNKSHVMFEEGFEIIELIEGYIYMNDTGTGVVNNIDVSKLRERIKGSKEIIKAEDLKYKIGYIQQPKKVVVTEKVDVIKYDSEIMKSFNDDGSINNPITQSYESRMSKGLAGHITSLNFNYTDSNWELKMGSKAPMLVKVDIQFAPIHDIPPGLDNNGMMRAPVYNIGKINKSLSEDILDNIRLRDEEIDRKIKLINTDNG